MSLRSATLLGLLLALMLAGCRPSGPSSSAELPTATLAIFGADTNVEILGRYAWPLDERAELILYRKPSRQPGRPGEAAPKELHYILVERTANGSWHVLARGSAEPSAAPDAPPPAARMIDFAVVGYSAPEERWLLVYGQTLAPGVAAVEGTFDSGQVLRDSTTEGGFVLVGVGATALCDLRVLGSAGQELRHIPHVTPTCS